MDSDRMIKDKNNTVNLAQNWFTDDLVTEVGVASKVTKNISPWSYMCDVKVSGQVYAIKLVLQTTC